MRTAALFLSTVSVLAFSLTSSGEPSSTVPRYSVYNETHPYQSRLPCERAPGNVLKGVMYDVSTGTKRQVALSNAIGPCRPSRNCSSLEDDT